MDISSVSDLIFVNFKWSILQKVSTFDSVEKVFINKEGIVDHNGKFYGILVKRGGSTVRLVNYLTDDRERNEDYKKVNDVLMSIRNAVIGKISGESRNGKKNTKNQKTGLR